MNKNKYIGNELEMFIHAKNWKKYWMNKIIPYLGENVLEVGAGIGSNTKALIKKNSNLLHWTCIEPDKKLADQISKRIDYIDLDKLEIKNCFLKDLNPSIKYDSILYIDVIEHIQNDQKELILAQKFLKKNGHLIILVPAYNYLYSPFDKTIGHYRRYNKKMLKQLIKNNLVQERIIYIDSVGVFISLLNKFILSQKYPTIKQILIWDKLIVPISQVTDKIIAHSFGKSLIGIWKK